MAGAVIAALVAPSASAQVAPPQPAAADRQGDVVVTGSYIGAQFSAPVETVALSADDLRDLAPSNLADALARLPAFAASIRTDVPVSAAAAGYNGQNVLNLRGLGPNRTLVLLDGERLPATNSGGTTDIDTLPQLLVRRVDVASGGTSAAYGSDAVAGVVNFVLDSGLEGLRGDAHAGISEHGDLPSTGAALAYGHALSATLRLTASVDVFAERGVRADEDTHRAWFERPAGQYPVPGTATVVTVVPDIRSSAGGYGGLITSGPLKGTTLLPGGALGTFDYGMQTGSAFQSGGSGPRVNIGFSPSQRRVVGFLRADATLSPSVWLVSDVLLADTYSSLGAFVSSQTGTANQFTVFADNAFLPDALRARMAKAGVSSVTIGRYDRDFPLVGIDDHVRVARGTLSLRSELASGWSARADVSIARTWQTLRETNLTINRSLYAATDAVTDPATGAIVCRSTLAGLDPGCVPLDIFGSGAPGAAAIGYVTGDSIKYLLLRQATAALGAKGPLPAALSLGAGRWSLAFGVEARRESIDQTTDPLSPRVTSTVGLRGAPSAQNGRPGAFAFFNPLPLAGGYSVIESHAELGVPLAKGLDLDLAIRAARHSRAGRATAWRVAASYAAPGGVRLRASRSRDVRTPNLLELFNAATQSSNTQLYQGRTTQNLTIMAGNPDLKPELADGLSYGIGVQEGRGGWLRASIDRWSIDIRDAIGMLSAQQTIDGCAAGGAAQCADVSLTAAGTLVTRTPSLNLNRQAASGIDLAVAARGTWRAAAFSASLLATHMLSSYTDVAGGGRIVTLGEPTTPRWSGTFQLDARGGGWSLAVQERYLGPSLFDATKQEGVDTNDNHAPAVWTTFLSVSRRLRIAGAAPELYVAVANVFDRDPPVATRNPTTFSSPTSGAYDPVGRYLTLGLRLRG